MTHIDTMKQALKFIEATNKSSSFWLVPDSNLNKTVTALRLAIEQAQKQEPVAKYSDIVSDGGMDPRNKFDVPPQRQPLTEEEIEELVPRPDGSAEADVVKVEVSPGVWGMEYSEIDAWSYPLVLQITRAIERAHGIGGEA